MPASLPPFSYFSRGSNAATRSSALLSLPSYTAINSSVLMTGFTAEASSPLLPASPQVKTREPCRTTQPRPPTRSRRAASLSGFRPTSSGLRSCHASPGYTAESQRPVEGSMANPTRKMIQRQRIGPLRTLFTGALGFLFALQVLVEPLDRQFLSLLPGLLIDAIMGDVRDRHQLLRSLGPLVGLDTVVLVVEQLFFFGEDEQHGTVGRLVHVLHRGVVHHPLADWRAFEVAHRDDSRLRITDLAVSALGRLVLRCFQARAECHPARIQCRNLADQGLDPRIARRHVNDVAPGIAASPQADPLGITLLFPGGPVEDVLQVRGLIQRIDEFP